MRQLAAVVVCLVATGCPDRSLEAVPPDTIGASIKEIPVSADIDIVFVIDNSSSTHDKQSLFSANFHHIIDALGAYSSGLPNLHLAVVDTTVDIGATGFSGCPSPDPRDNGLMQTGVSCPVTGRFISDVKSDTGRTTNYSGTLADAFACIASVGDQGCGFEAPLEAMKRALDGSRPENAGFIRDGAYLAVIFLTDEDDASVGDTSVFGLDASAVGPGDFRVQPLYAYQCDQAISASGPGSYTNCKVRRDSYLQDPASYTEFLRTVKDPAQTVVAVIASPPPGFATNDSPAQTANANTSAIATGPLTFYDDNNNVTAMQTLALQPSTTCTIGTNTHALGRPALRLVDFLSSYGPDRGRFYNVCQADYSAALADIGNTLFRAVSPCLGANIAQPFDCTVTDIQNLGTSSETDELMVPCTLAGGAPTPDGPRPCWYIDQQLADCPAPSSGYEIHFVRTQQPPTGTVTQLECAISGT